MSEQKNRDDDHDLGEITEVIARSNYSLRRQLREAKKLLARNDELYGSNYADRTISNDGRLWARLAYDNREGWIRCFAGQALCGAYVKSYNDIRINQIADDAQALWLELESRFAAERAGREAIREAKRQADERQGELWRPDDQIQNKETEAKS